MRALPAAALACGLALALALAAGTAAQPSPGPEAGPGQLSATELNATAGGDPAQPQEGSEEDGGLLQPLPVGVPLPGAPPAPKPRRRKPSPGPPQASRAAPGGGAAGKRSRSGLPDDVPPEVAGAMAYDAAAGPALAPKAEGDKRRIGTLTSLLDPPPGFAMPDLTPAQRDAIPKLRQLRRGISTIVYRRAVNNLDAGSMNCGIGYINNHFIAYFAGVGDELYRGGEVCGVCLQLWCVDSVCEEPLTRNATFMIVDSCKDCKGNNLVVSGRGMANLTGLSIDDNPSVQVAWRFTSCAPLIKGSLKMLPSDSTSANFLGLNFSNSKQLIKAVKLNGIAMQRTNYGYWVINSPEKPIDLKPPYTLELLGANNQRLEKRTPNLRAQDLGVQFDA